MRHRRVDASNRRQRTLISIRQLTEQVVNGMPPEVVERPTSVVKDLMENASNAGPSRIDIFSDGGGLRRIGGLDAGRHPCDDRISGA